MNDDNKKMEVATFRFGIISEFVTGVYLNWGDKEKLLKEKSLRKYEIPYSDKTRITKSTICRWINLYKEGGHRIESLYPCTRVDKGTYRKLDPAIRLSIKDIKKEMPRIGVPALVKELKHRRQIDSDARISYANIYRFLANENLKGLNESAIDKRAFEAEYPNELWQSDVMHGPKIVVNGKNKKTYLIAIIDDHSRLIIHAEFYLSEGLDNFKDCLKEAVMSRGLPQKLYIDNGSCYKAKHLEQIAAALSIAIHHSRPYIPQGRGKIERWFKFIRDNFLPTTRAKTFEDLNEELFIWVYDYNHQRKHGTTGRIPIERFKKHLECIRPAPNGIDDYFRRVDYRKVKKDRTFRLNSILYEAPTGLIDRKIQVKYHNDELDKVEVFYDDMSFGFAVPVDYHINYKIGRNWYEGSKKEPEILTEEDNTQTGELSFGGNNNE